MRYIILFLIVFSSCSIDHPKEIYLWGDSHITRYDSKYWFPDCQSINNGISGLYIDEMKQAMSFTDDEIIIIQVGTNDILNEIVKGRNCEEIIELVSNKYHFLLDYIEQNSSNKIIITSILPLTDTFISSECNIADIYYSINKNIQEKIFLYSNIKFVNLYPQLSYENKFLKNQYSYDGIHINKSGYSKITHEIYEKLY